MKIMDNNVLSKNFLTGFAIIFLIYEFIPNKKSCTYFILGWRMTACQIITYIQNLFTIRRILDTLFYEKIG